MYEPISEASMIKVIEHQVSIELRHKGLKSDDLNELEHMKLKYEMAIKLLRELR